MHLHRGKWDTTSRQCSPTHNDNSFSRTWGQIYQTQTHPQSGQPQRCWCRSNTEVSARVSCEAKNEFLCMGSSEVLAQRCLGAQGEWRKESCCHSFAPPWVTNRLRWTAILTAAAPVSNSTPNTGLSGSNKIYTGFQAWQRLGTIPAERQMFDSGAVIYRLKWEHLPLSSQSGLLTLRKSCI